MSLRPRRSRTANESFSSLIPAHKSVPDNSVAYRCLERDDIDEAVEQWEIPGFGLWQVQAVRLPSFDGSPRRAAALVVADQVPRFINTTTFVASIFGSGEARRGSIPRSGAVTEEQHFSDGGCINMRTVLSNALQYC